MQLLLVIFAFLSSVSSRVLLNDNIINKNVERVIDLSTQLAKITSTITYENVGKDPLVSYPYEMEHDLIGNLSYFSVKDNLKNEMKVVRVNRFEYEIMFNQPVQPGKTGLVVVEIVLAGALIPYPNSISQKERQLVRFEGSAYLFTQFITKKQMTTVTLNNQNIESYTKVKPYSQSETSIVYGPYFDLRKMIYEPIVIHFENNSPFLEVTFLERDIEVSHWGNIAIQENVEILHTGAKLKGPFSRYDYQREPAHHSIKSYRSILPAAAHSIYYRDSNGNISTSQVRHRKDWIELELRPRFPLFGGWKSSYTLGYSIPSYQYLFRVSQNRYLLKMRLMDHVFDDMHVQELETHITLPIGVKDVQVNLPYEIERLKDGVTHKYLDTIGRQVIKLKKVNLVEQHIQDVEITYDWQPALLFHEPLLISAILYFLFIVVIVYVRLDFSISGYEHGKNQ